MGIQLRGKQFDKAYVVVELLRTRCQFHLKEVKKLVTQDVMNRLEELGRVDAERVLWKKGKRNLKAEKRRIVRELKS